MADVVDCVWCQSIVRSPDAGEWFLGGYQAASPRLAVRWLRGQAARLANALDPQPGCGSLPHGCLREVSANAPNPGRIFREWAEDFPHQEKQMQTLAGGHLVSINAGGPDRIFGLSGTDVFYSLSARPVSVTFVTNWRLRTPRFAAA
ncbi:hypothetical protein [Streptomyces acidicola]|uniref:Uncharacterized protein n=1 Tax=Streptomyces acidicola TaxID=2596892 RepID=A0A5N8X379_9ACTN|nr:hypothetical protein [Streptomyces acidicola]MPY53464.1 hypothetical protein [Streptomyces acidicola]